MPSKPAKNTFSRNQRLTKRAQFLRLFDSPNVYRASTFYAFWKENNERSSRLGITIKGRLSTVWRMKIKRLIREWFRKSKFHSEKPFVDLNIVIKVPQKAEKKGEKKLDHMFLDRLRRQLQGWNF